jgi:hypothetical protein
MKRKREAPRRYPRADDVTEPVAAALLLGRPSPVIILDYAEIFHSPCPPEGGAPEIIGLPKAKSGRSIKVI